MGISSFPASSGGSGGKAPRFVEIKSTSTWTCPSDVTEVDIMLCGGGGGSYHDPVSALRQRGGGGSVIQTKLNVTPNTTYTVTIGAGGSSNSTGGTSSFGELLSITGGLGGSNGSGVGMGSGGSFYTNTTYYFHARRGYGVNGFGQGGVQGDYGGSVTYKNGAANTGNGASGGSGGSGGSGTCILRYWTAE